MGDDSSGLVTVISPNHHEILVCGLWKFLTDLRGVDFSIQLGERTLAAHQLVLEVFLSPEKLLQAAYRINNDELSMQETNSSVGRRECIFNSVVEFLYNGQVIVQEEQLKDLLDVAKELDCKILLDALTCSATARAVDVDNDEQSSLPVVEVESGGPVTRGQRRGKLTKIAELEQTIHRGEIDNWIQSPNKKLRVDKGENKETEAGVDSFTSGDGESDGDGCDSVSGNTFVTKTPLSTCMGGETKTIDDGAGNDSLSQVQTSSTCTKKRRSKRQLLGTRLHDRKCQFCDYVTSNNMTFQIHMTKHDSSIPVFKCADCSRKFLNEETLNKHKIKHADGPELYECPHCDYKVRTKTRYRIHLAKHDPSIAVFRCGTCGRQVFNEEALQRHMLKHKIYKCTHCEFETPKRWSYDHHLFSKHQVNCKGEPINKLLCSQCSFTCKTESELKYHTIAKHSGDRPHKCPQCNFSSGRKGDVGKHIKSIHLNLRPCLCETCGYRTVSQSALEQHKRSHTGQKVFKCDIDDCEKSYGDHSTLRRHKQVAHSTSGKPFICHVCGNSYNRRDHLRIHLTKAHEILSNPVVFNE